MTDRDPLAEARAFELAQAEALIRSQVDRSSDEAQIEGINAESPDASPPPEVDHVRPDPGLGDPVPDPASCPGPDPVRGPLDWPFVAGPDLPGLPRELASRPFGLSLGHGPGGLFADFGPQFAGSEVRLTLPDGTRLSGVVNPIGVATLNPESPE